MNTEVYRWRLGIGDPTIEGWLICTLYFIGFILSFKKSINVKVNSTVSHKTWTFISLTLLFLSLNKQLDLQTLISDTGRAIAINLELMEQRHIFKRVFILVVALCGIIFLIKYKENVVSFNKNYHLAFVGMTTLITFVFLRAISFHIFSDTFNNMLENIYFFKALELTSILILLLSILISDIEKEDFHIKKT